MMTFRKRLSLAWRVLRSAETNSLRHAERELAAMRSSGDDMNQAMADDLEEMVLVFSTQGHSGFSAGYAINALEKLLNLKPLGPLTGADDEWGEVSEEDGVPVLQNKRDTSVFKKGRDGQPYTLYGYVFEKPEQDLEGKPYCLRYTGLGSARAISFPYTPVPPTVVKVDAEGNRLDGKPRLPIMPEIEEEPEPRATDERLLQECAETFRFYEASHRAKEGEVPEGSPERAERHAKTERNRIMAEKCEAALAGCETLADLAPLALLAEAVKGSALIESSASWVKVHGLADPDPLFKLLTAAKLASEQA